MEGESQNLPEPPADTSREALQEEVIQVEGSPSASEKLLSEEERKRLTNLEGEVEEGFRRWLETTAEIGQRLMAIHDERLYREDYGSFEAYCNARWQIERAQGNRLVDYGRVAEAVSPVGDIPIPASERQARELAPLAKADPEAARRVWQRLLDDNGGAKPRSYMQVNAAVQPERQRLKQEREEAAKTEPSQASQETSDEDSEEPATSEDEETKTQPDDDPVAFLKNQEGNEARLLSWHRGDFAAKKSLETLPPNSVRLLLADPPYGVDHKSKSKHAHERLENDKTSESAEALLRRILDEMSTKLADDAHVLLFCAPINEPQMRKIVEAEPDLDIRSYPVWVKNAPSPGDTISGLAPTHERLIHATKGNPPPTGFLRDNRINDVLLHSRVSADKHPTRKPAALLREIIGALTDAGDIVADPVGGSGSTLVAALQRGRRAWGAEYAPGYHEEGAERIAEELRKPGAEDATASATAGTAPLMPMPEVPSEKPSLASDRIVAKIYGLREPFTEARSSPPSDEAYLFPVLRAWLSSFSEKPRTLVEPFAFYQGQNGLLASLAYPALSNTAESTELPEPPLAERILLMESEQSENTAAAWRTLLDDPYAIRLVEGLGLLHYAAGSLSTQRIVNYLGSSESHFYSGGELTPSEDLAQVSVEEREALRFLFSHKPFWIPEMARAAEPSRTWSLYNGVDSDLLTAEERDAFYQQESEIYEREDLDHEDRQMLEQERGFLKTERSIRRLSQPLEESIRRLSKAVESGEVEFRKPADAAKGVPASGLEALEDPQLASDPQTAFFVVPPRNIGYEDALRLLAKVAGDAIACMPESRTAITRARNKDLEVRRLGRGRIADYEPSDMILVGKNLSFADE